MEPDSVYRGEELGSRSLEANAPIPPQPHRLTGRSALAGTSVSSRLFPLAAFQLDFLEQVPGLSPQPGSVKHH